MTIATLIASLCMSGCNIEDGSDLRPSPPTLASEIITADDPDTSEDSIDPAGADESPANLSFAASPVFCCNPLSFEFTATVSGAGTANAMTFAWDFGDADTGSGAQVSHTYGSPGTYTVQLVGHFSNGDPIMVAGAVEVGATVPGTTIIGDPVIAPAASLSADAGLDQTVLGGTTVTLAGAILGADAEGDLETLWRQVAGIAVGLNGANDSSTSFAAPDPGEGAVTLEFEFQVTGAEVVSDRVYVIVWPTTPQDGNTSPFVNDVSVTLDQNASTPISLTGSDVDGDDLVFTILAMPAHGSLIAMGSDDAMSARWLYTPLENFTGTDRFTFRTEDGSAVSNTGTATILVTALDTPPVAIERAYLAPMSTPVSMTLMGEGDADLTFELTTPPIHGTLDTIDNGPLLTATAIYTPEPGFEGIDAFAYRVRDGAAASETASVTITVSKLLVPWIEVNDPTAAATDRFTAEQGALPGMTMVDYCLVGIEHWSQVTDTIMVSTMPGQSRHLYPQLMERKPPHVRIIGGLKTLRLPGGTRGDSRAYNFADAAGWETLAEEAAEIVDYTGINIVVLENETTLTPYTFGEVSINFDQLGTSLAALRTRGIEVWWNLPRILPDLPEFPGRESDTTTFVLTIATALPDSTFLGGYTAWYDWRPEPSLRGTMIDLLGVQRMHERLLVTPDGYIRTADFEKRCFTPPEAIERASALMGTQANIYPGASNWVVVGRSFAEELPVLAIPIR